jgi:hypothetical protein
VYDILKSVYRDYIRKHRLWYYELIDYVRIDVCSGVLKSNKLGTTNGRGEHWCLYLVKTRQKQETRNKRVYYLLLQVLEDMWDVLNKKLLESYTGLLASSHPLAAIELPFATGPTRSILLYPTRFEPFVRASPSRDPIVIWALEKMDKRLIWFAMHYYITCKYPSEGILDTFVKKSWSKTKI